MLDRNNISSIVYWRRSPEHKAQRFYIAFCLFVSSVQDTLLGIRERNHQNLNWSTTCSYYGMVHAGRMLTFLALGDFPKNHESMRNLFRPGSDVQNARGTRNTSTTLNWLMGLDPSFRSQTGNRLDFRETIVSYFLDLGIQSSIIDEFGKMLYVAKPLREDGNYEALLIAHEYEHTMMSTSFADLSRAMSCAAEKSLSLLETAYSAYLANDPDIENNRNAYRSFLYDYLRFRVFEAIARKLEGSCLLVKRLEEICQRIQPTTTHSNYRELEEMVSMRLFSGKNRMMENFANNIAALEEAMRNTNSL